jgi:exonuclease III
MYTNIASLMAKFNDFSMEIANSKPNIIALTETWLNSDVSNNMIGLNNYKVFRKDRINGRGGGVCIYVNENLIKNKFQITVLDISVEPYEYDTLWITFSSNLFSFVIACVYRPPLNASSNSIENDRKLINVIEDQFKNLSNLIIVGDFNYPNIKWKADCYSSSSFSDSLFTDMLNDNNISQAVSDFTRFRHNQKSSLLDLVLISDCNLISNLSTSDPIGLSDHCTIEIDLQVILYSNNILSIKNGNDNVRISDNCLEEELAMTPILSEIRTLSLTFVMLMRLFARLNIYYKTFLTRMQCDTTPFTSCCHNVDFCIAFLRQSANNYRHCSFCAQISPVVLKNKQ